MGKYNFDKVIDRKSSWAIKWDIKDGELPMWVADMDFETAPEVKEALVERLGVGAYGYTYIPDEWYDAYISWWKRRHHLKINKDELIFSTGVIPTLSSSVRKLTTPNENVVIMTPVYNVFYNCIVNNGARALESRLVMKDGRWEIDFEDLEQKLSDPQTTLLLLCNPHNPVGRIWSKEELIKIGELCYKHRVTVISDEIHCDITDPDKEYVPFAAASDICRDISITALAPSKSFNMAGMATSAAFVPNEFLRHKVWRQINTDECGEPSFLAVTAAIAAFTKGEEWLDELNEYVYGNKCYCEEFITNNIPGVKILHSEATYLIWVDCSDITKGKDDLARFIREKTGLFITRGGQYGPGGEGFLRINLACPRSIVVDGMDRLKKGIELYKEAHEDKE
ncbi:MalY/PatB family protein [Butyrivibrio sp. TB]|uniref:MalY/PatB family protein n=1 Tax=Butyrivibrio sp. TB TaxID=1520809 RepID=UPI0008AC222A|nr:MalY/PatB family protein [Butyrivibrio sp. TB]SEQ03521.1 cystathione beta-lyase [Butyrivibrio sp. TB]